MSVLRSSALSTGTRVVRAVVGTTIGFLLGVAFIELMGFDPIVLWTALPLVAFGSAYVPEVASFVAGQAMFTMMVLIIFNVISPSGWQVGLIRVEDVLVGAMVGAVVSLLVAVKRVTRGASEAATNRAFALGHDAMTALRTLDDVVRHYLSESGGSSDLRAPVIHAANRAVRVRTAAELIADVVPPPLTAYPRVREVLELHTTVVRERLHGRRPVHEVGPIGDDFVLALRAEAGDSGLSIRAALPMVTVAANLGELELLYPDPIAVPDR